MHLHSDRTGPDQSPGPEAPRNGAGPRPGPAGLVAQRQADPDAVSELQRTVGNAAVAQLLQAQLVQDGDEPQVGRSPVLDVVGRGGGDPLDDKTRPGMEQALGADLSGVRIHTDSAAAESARSVQAHAYTVGDDVVFGSGQYQPDTPGGQRMLAHELTHVIQQRRGPVAGTPTGDGISVSDPSDAFEQAAEANADRIMSTAGDHEGASNGPDGGTSAQLSGEPAQRVDAAEEEEEPVQGAWVQREGGDQEEEEEPA
jgi:hypothetical protein